MITENHWDTSRSALVRRTFFSTSFFSTLTSLALVLCMTAGTAHAQVSDLSGASLADLMKVEVQSVFGASERLQPVTEAPSAVTIVTADDIQRYGYRTLADVLRGVRGFYVTDDRNYSHVGVRGFGRSGDYNTRVLLLLNGQRLNDNVYDQAAIGADLGIDVTAIARVEVIRGPSSSLYGTNAFFGVINIVTKTGTSATGTTVEAGSGTLGTRTVKAITGDRLANGLDYVVSGAWERSDGMRELFFPELATMSSSGIAQDLDTERARSAYARLRVGSFTFTATTGWRHKDVPTASFGTAVNAQDPPEFTIDRRTFVSADFERPIGRTRVSLSASLLRYRYDGTYPYAGDEPGTLGEIAVDGVDGVRLTYGARATRTLPGRQTFTAGLELTDNVRQLQWVGGTGAVDSWRLDESSRHAAIFLQDEISAARWLRLSGGLRYDDLGQFQRTTPRVAVIAGPSRHVVKYLYGRAFRAPNAYERSYWTDASRYLKPETIGTHELVWERYFGDWLRTSAAAYAYDATQLIAFVSVAPEADIPEFGFANDGKLTARGAELEAEIRLKHGVQFFAGFAGQRVRDRQGASLPNSPTHLANIRASVGDVDDSRFASIELLHSSGWRTLAGRTLPAANLVNLTASVPLRSGVSLAASARNLFDLRYSTPSSREHAMDAIEQNGRTIRLDLRWSFGQH